MGAWWNVPVLLAASIAVAGCFGTGGPGMGPPGDGVVTVGAWPHGDATARLDNALIEAPSPLPAAASERLRARRQSLRDSRATLLGEQRLLERELAGDGTPLARQVAILIRLRHLDRRLDQADAELAAVERGIAIADEQPQALDLRRPVGTEARF